MNLEITAEWLKSFDEDIPEPTGAITPRERAELARRLEALKAKTMSEQPEAQAEDPLETAVAGRK